MTIANFVIIDDDSKIRQELIRYIRELDAESTVLEFVSSTEFEHRFLLPIAHAATGTTKAVNPLEAFNPEQVKKINELTLSKKEPFPGELLSVELKKSDYGVIKTNLLNGEVFGQEVIKTFSGNASIEKFLHPDYKSSFDSFKTKLETATQDVTTSIIVKGQDEQIWILEISGHFKNEMGQFQIRNKTYETLRLLGKDKDEEKKEETKPQTIDVVFFRSDCIADKDLMQWVNKIAAVTKKLKLWPENNRPKFIGTRFEDDKKEKSEYNHPFVDDLLCLPFDRLIILQKLELILALPEKATPSYLFVQQTQQNLEVAKKVIIEKFSDLGFAVANPVPLEVGTPGHFYFRFPGQKNQIDVHGRVTNCLPHPERPKEFLAYFSFFGLNRNSLKEIRAYLSRDSGYKMYVNQKADDFEFNPDNIFLTEDQKQVRTVAIIDPDEKTLENVNSILRKDIGGVQVVTDSSYFNFFKNYLSAPTERTPPALAEDLYQPIVSFLVDGADLNLQMCLSPPDAEQKLLGHDANQIFASPQGWFELFKNETSRNLINEAVYLVQTQNRLKRTIDLTHATGQLRAVVIELVLEENKKTVRVNISVPAKSESKSFEKLKSLDALIIERRAINTDLNAFAASLKETLNKEGIKCPPDGPRIILVSDELGEGAVENILSTKIDGLVFKPLEVKRVCYILSSLLSIPFTLHNFENIGWKTDLIPAKLARSAEMIELSEFGATLKMSQKLRVGTMFYLFRGIFKNAPDANLCCRVYASEANESEENGGFLNYVSYFGITDAFLKFTRSYIRETYADSKAKEGSGSEEEL